MPPPQRPPSLLKTRLVLILLGAVLSAWLPNAAARWRVLLVLSLYGAVLIIEQVLIRRAPRLYAFGWPTAVRGVLALLAIHWTGSINSPVVAGLTVILLDGLRAGFSRLQLAILQVGLSVGLAVSGYLAFGAIALGSVTLWLEIAVTSMVGVLAIQLVGALQAGLRSLWREARRDALTGLWNRRSFDEVTQVASQPGGEDGPRLRFSWWIWTTPN